MSLEEKTRLIVLTTAVVLHVIYSVVTGVLNLRMHRAHTNIILELGRELNVLRKMT